MVIIIITAYIGNLLVMTYFMCQFDRAPGCPDIWSDIFLSVSVGVFLYEINI